MAYTPLAIPGCKVWLDAQAIEGLSNNDPVPTWSDLSGNSHDATAVSDNPLYQTSGINAYPSLLFGGANPMAMGDLSAHFGTAATLFVIIKSNGGSPLLVRPPFVDRETTNAAGVWNLDGVGYLDCFKTARQDGYPASGIPNGTNPHMWCIDSGATSWFLAIDGTSFATQTANHSSGTAYYIGRSANGGGIYYYAGLIGEVLLYDTALGTDDRQEVEGYLAWKWGTQASLPVDHPYKDAAPTGFYGVLKRYDGDSWVGASIQNYNGAGWDTQFLQYFDGVHWQPIDNTGV